MKRIHTVACSTLLTLPLLIPAAITTRTPTPITVTVASAPTAAQAVPSPLSGQTLRRRPNQRPSPFRGADPYATHQRIAIARFARAQALARAAAIARAKAAAQAAPVKVFTNTTSSASTSGSAPVTSASSIRGMIAQVFGSYATQATTVAECESTLNPHARNASGASGLFQILPTTWAATPEHATSPFNAWANINAAHWLFVRDGYSWREWQCAA